jgi:3-hydroxymyristoyl/3-hydroxydecanoyl-(acyl carrier protein) dehydratase
VNDWLRHLPHQIPFRAVSAARRLSDQEIEGTLLVSGGDALAEGGGMPQVMLFEAMAQIGGALVFQNSRPAMLSAIDSARIDTPFSTGDLIRLLVRLEVQFGGIYRFSGTAVRDGVEIGRARFYLAEEPDSQHAST